MTKFNNAFLLILVSLLLSACAKKKEYVFIPEKKQIHEKLIVKSFDEKLDLKISKQKKETDKLYRYGYTYFTKEK
jgi:outer membrane biogenesis lipoprotein LolB